MLELIKKLLKAVWNFIKKIVTKVISFFDHIFSFFIKLSHKYELAEDKKIIAVSIKEKLESGNYNIVNVLFDKEKEEIVNPEEDALIVEGESLDDKTRDSFKDKEMIILQ